MNTRRTHGCRRNHPRNVVGARGYFQTVNTKLREVRDQDQVFKRVIREMDACTDPKALISAIARRSKAVTTSHTIEQIL